MAQLDLDGWNFREIKKDPVTEVELDEMHKLSGSYESLFSKKSTQIKQLGINVKDLTEPDLRRLILQHYSFLKRPVFVYNGQIFAGNDKQTVAQLVELLGTKAGSK